MEVAETCSCESHCSGAGEKIIFRIDSSVRQRRFFLLQRKISQGKECVLIGEVFNFFLWFEGGLSAGDARAFPGPLRGDALEMHRGPANPGHLSLPYRGG